MPVCEISYLKGLIQDKELDNIVEKLTILLLEAEGLEINSKSKSLCYIAVNELDINYIAGQRSDTGKIIIKVYAFSKAYDDLRRKQLYSEINKLFIKEHRYTEKQNGNNIWTIIIPIEHNNFGISGLPITLEMTKKFLGDI